MEILVIIEDKTKKEDFIKSLELSEPIKRVSNNEVITNDHEYVFHNKIGFATRGLRVDQVIVDGDMKLSKDDYMELLYLLVGSCVPPRYKIQVFG